MRKKLNLIEQTYLIFDYLVIYEDEKETVHRVLLLMFFNLIKKKTTG